MQAVDEIAGAYGWTIEQIYRLPMAAYLRLSKSIRRRKFSDHLLFVGGVVHPYREKEAAASYIKAIELEAGVNRQSEPLDRDKLTKLKKQLAGK